jgi:Uma2 family endonuclease
MLVDIVDFKAHVDEYLARLRIEEIIIIMCGDKKLARLEACRQPSPEPLPPLKLSETAKPYEPWPRKATYQEFLELSSNSEEQFEYIDGEIYLMTAPKVVHQSALGELYRIFASWFKGKSCRPFFAPFDITLKRTAANINVVQPDLMVICDLDRHMNTKGYYMGVPTLLVEILSESTRGKDSLKKLDLYLAAGVSEYWIINPISREIAVMSFEKGRITDGRMSGTGESVESILFKGLQVEVDELFQ